MIKKTKFHLLFILILIFSNAFANNPAENQISLLKNSAIKKIISMRDFLHSTGKKAEFENVVKLVTLADGTKAVFKPIPPDDMGDAHAEVAAYKASKFLGFPDIPPTIIRKINDEIGSLQLYIEPSMDIPTPSEYKEILQMVASDEVANLKLFYFVFGQWDSGPHNLIIQKRERKFHLVAIDNSGIRSRQYVKYGDPPFVRVCYSDTLQTDDWHLPFPYDQVQTLQNPSYENLKKSIGEKFPEKIIKNLSRFKNSMNYIIYKNSLWIQFHAFDPHFVRSYTDVYPEKTIESLKRLNKNQLLNIFSEAKGADFLTKDYIEAILERRDQVLKHINEGRNSSGGK